MLQMKAEAPYWTFPKKNQKTQTTKIFNNSSLNKKYSSSTENEIMLLWENVIYVTRMHYSALTPVGWTVKVEVEFLDFAI